jgi:predicted transcriptional regulator
MLGIMASSISGSKIATGAFYSIATATVTSGGTTSVTFSSIPSTYTHLQIRAIANDTTTSAPASSQNYVTFNGDTGTNYWYHSIYGNGTTASSQGGSGYSGIYVLAGATTGGVANNLMTPSIMDILDYTNTNKYKTTRTLSGTNVNATGGGKYIALQSGAWANTAAITSIVITSLGTAFDQYSSFALYGVK